MAQIKIGTRDFATVEISEDDIIDFDPPILGFEEQRRYVFLYEEENQHIVWLQSVEVPQICFVLVDTSVISSTGGPEIKVIPPSSLDEGDCWIGLIMVVAPEFDRSTVNLRSPIVVNLALRRGAQVILEEDYPIRYPLFQKKGGLCSC